MSFLYFFDLFDFDENGKVCESKHTDLQHARSNFLYLLAKYNQMFLQEEGIPLPDFFKQDLSALLQCVEEGFDFSIARAKVLQNCLPKIKAQEAQSDKALISALAERVSIKDMEFATKFKTATNNLQLAYIITHISGSKFEEIWKSVSNKNLSKQEKSKLFKNIIMYNSLVATADKVKIAEEFDVDSLIG